MKKMLSAALLLVAVSVVGGCGGGASGGNTSGNAVAKSASCFSTSHVGPCHSGGARKANSQVTGLPIVAEWQASIHFKNNVAGCVDCHEADSNHYCAKCHGGLSREPVNNPDAAGKCGKCHGLDHPEDRLMVYAPQHFGNMTASASNTRYRASYVSLNYIGKCRKCHNPHDPSSNAAYNANWARSGHGDTLSGSRGSEFKARGNTFGAALSYGNSQSSTLYPTLPEQRIYCVRCHTTTGYINFVTSGFTNVSPFPTVVNADTEVVDKTKEVTACDACHTSYAFNLASLRRVDPVTVYYNHRNKTAPNNIDITNNAVTFPDAGYSNLCIPCHSARQNGDVIKLIAKGTQGSVTDFSSLTRVSPHDLGGSASLFRKIGYEFEGLDYSNKAGYKHESIGMASSGGTPKGPCIMCHLNTEVRAESHLFMPVTEVSDTTVKSASFGTQITGVVSLTCAVAGCHVGSLAPWTDVAGLQAKKAGFYAAMQALLEWQAIAQTVTFINRYKTPHQVTYTTDWRKINGVIIDPSTGHTYPAADNMGATFNYDALKNDPGAFAHNDVYTKRLIYDSINWLRQADPTVISVADALDKLAAGKYANGSFSGNPSNYGGTTSYVPGDLVLSGVNIYRNIKASKGVAPPNATYWTLETPPNYNNAITYVPGDQVLASDGYIYLNVTSSTGIDPVTPPAIFTSTTAYVPGDVVLGSDGKIYRNVVAITGIAPPNTSHWEQVTYWVQVGPSAKKFNSNTYFPAAMRDAAKTWLGGGLVRL